jgi:hypothetical protein
VTPHDDGLRSTQLCCVAPIRSFSSKEGQHPSSRARLRLSETDGQDDRLEHNVEELTKTNMAEAIAKLEGLIQQVTALADNDALALKSSHRRTRRLSETIADKGYRYLAKANSPPASGQANQRLRRQVTFQEEKGVQRSSLTALPSEAPENEILSRTSRIAEPVLSIESTTETPERSRGLDRDPRTELWKAYAKSPPTGAEELSSPQTGQATTRTQQRLGLPSALQTDRDHHDVADRATNNSCPSPRSADPNIIVGRSFTQMFGTRHSHSVFKYDRSQTSDSHIVDLRRVNHVDL